GKSPPGYRENGSSGCGFSPLQARRLQVRLACRRQRPALFRLLIETVMQSDPIGMLRRSRRDQNSQAGTAGIRRRGDEALSRTALHVSLAMPPFAHPADTALRVYLCPYRFCEWL